MRKFFYLISLPAFLVIMNYPKCWAQEISRPKMVLEEKVFDAKEINEGGFIEHEFLVLNAGDSPLEITKVKVS